MIDCLCNGGGKSGFYKTARQWLAFPSVSKCEKIRPTNTFAGINEMLDREGYRPNVGIILCNAKNEVFWGKRIREHSWQFPQGGIKRGETPEQAMFRELYEEIGLRPEHVCVLGRTRDWLRYDVPTHWVKREWRGSYRGQKQIWFLLRLTGDEAHVRLDQTETPEFDHWRWVDFWYPVEHVVIFKRRVFASALGHLASFARSVAGPQAVPPQLPDPRAADGARRRNRDRPGRKRGGLGEPAKN